MMHDEEIESREYDWNLMKRLLVYIRPYKWRVIAAITIMLAIAGLQILTPWLIKIAIDEYVSKRDLIGLYKIAVYYLLVLLAELVLSYLQVYIMQMTGQRIMYDMRVQIFQHLQNLELKYYHRNPVGRLMTRVTNDVDVLNELFTSGVV